MSNLYLMHSINRVTTLTLFGFIVFVIPGLEIWWLGGALLMGIGILYGVFLWMKHHEAWIIELSAAPKIVNPYLPHPPHTPRRFEEAELAMRVEALEAEALGNEKVKLLKKKLQQEEKRKLKRQQRLLQSQQRVRTISDEA